MVGVWTTVDISGKRADVFDLAGGQRPRYGLLYLHSGELESLRDRPVFSHLLEELKLACLCPQGGFCWWAARVCPEFDPQLTPERHLLDNVLPFFSTRWSLEPRAIGLLGVSMGGQGALRLAFKYPHLFPVVGAISSSVDFHEWYGRGTPLDEMYESREHCRQDTAVLHIHPMQYPPHILFVIDPADAPWYRGNDRLHEKLAALGIPHEIDLTTRAGGHSWDYFNHMAPRVLRFVVSGLEQESRRLL
jgi:pimeloyl-ACP methyl ester carboxylesterase